MITPQPHKEEPETPAFPNEFLGIAKPKVDPIKPFLEPEPEGLMSPDQS
jgi:hypothetical protein